MSAEYASEHLGEIEGEKQKHIDEVRKWLGDNPKLGARTEDEHIVCFLRGCKYNTEHTKEKITRFYTMRAEVPEWFSNRDPMLPEMQELLRLGLFLLGDSCRSRWSLCDATYFIGCFVPLSKFHEGRLVVIIRAAAHDPSRHNQNDVFKADKMVLDVAVKEHFENATVFGVAAVIDMRGVTLAHGRQLTPKIIKKAVHAWQNYHCRPKQLEFINAPTYINVLVKVFKSFMSQKLRERVRVHFSGDDPLVGIISKEVLPTEYGGTNGVLQDHIDYWVRKVEGHRDWFLEDEKYKADLG